MHSAEAECGWYESWQSSQEAIWHPGQLVAPLPSTFTLPPVIGSAVQQIRAGSNRTACFSDRDSQQAEAGGKREPFVSPTQHVPQGGMMAGILSEDLNGSAWPPMLMAQHLGTHISLHPWDLCWKAQTGIYFILLSGAKKGKTKKKDNSIPPQI